LRFFGAESAELFTRQVAGVDDSSPGAVRIILRLPETWSGYEATGWPILTAAGLAYADIRCERVAGGLRLDVSLQTAQGTHRHTTLLDAAHLKYTL
jgi:hypothetical protein